MTEYLSITEAADLLGYTRSRLHQWKGEPCPYCDGEGCEKCLGTGKRLPTVQMGTQYMVPAEFDVSTMRNDKTGERLLDDETIERWNDGTES